MVRIAICDDEQKCIDDCMSLIEEYRQSRRDIETEIKCFRSAKSLLDARVKKAFDLYILDIYIDVQTGVDIAKEIRQNDKEAGIIFLTTSAVHYRDAIKVHAVDYLEKPVEKNEFFDALDRVFEEERDKYYVVKDIGGITKVRKRDILYVTSEDHYKSITAVDRSYFARSTMKDILDGLNDDNFYLLNNKVIINLKRMMKVTSSEIEMENGQIFPVPRGSYKTLKELLLKSTFD